MKTKLRLAWLRIIASLILVGIITLWFVVHKASEKRSWLGRTVRWWNGEHLQAQYVHDLTEDVRHSPKFTGLQPWAIDILARYRTGQVRTNNYWGFVWADSSVTLALNEMPDFLSPDWVMTNYGVVLPEISIVLSNNRPVCVVLDWDIYAIAVGEPEYRLSFSHAPNIVTNVSPGIYIFGYMK